MCCREFVNSFNSLVSFVKLLDGLMPPNPTCSLFAFGHHFKPALEKFIGKHYKK